MNEGYSFEGKENLDVMHCAIKCNQEIFNFLTKNIERNILVLDFGAGLGEFCNRLNGENIAVIEADESFHSSLKYKAYRSFDEIQSKFDLIYSSNVLEHIEYDKLIVEQFYKHLNVNGVVRVFLPAKMCYFQKWIRL